MNFAALFDAFRKPAIAPAAEPSPPVNGGFFSTDILPRTGQPDAQYVAAMLKQTFQILPNSFRAVDEAGKEVAAVAGTGLDSYEDCTSGSVLRNTGGYLPIAQVGWYASQGFIGYQTCAMLAQNWLIDKACTMPGNDAMRHGYELSVNDGIELDPKVLDEIRKLDKAFRIKANCRQFVKMGRVFGIRHALFLVDGIDYSTPFNPDGVKPGSYRGISQIDPYWITPELDAQAAGDPSAINFYEPTWWRINGKRVHRSHLIIMRNGEELADILKPSYMYGGISVPQRISERVYAAERTANEAPMLAMTKRLTSLQIDAAQALANPVAFQQKMELWTLYQNNFGVKVIGEKEQIAQYDTSLTGLDETVMTQYQLVATASGVPATKLLGTTPKGFNSSGEYEEGSYHEELESIQENILSPLIERHHLLLIRSVILPKFGMAPFNTEVNWEPVDSPTAKEVAEINKIKADTDKTYADAGAIDGFDIRSRLIADPDSGYMGIPDVVPGGPGDREAEREREEEERAAEAAGNESGTAADSPDGRRDAAAPHAAKEPVQTENSTAEKQTGE